MRDPDISVVMSVYNNPDTLPSALESILSQEGVELEFVVIDDGSTATSEKFSKDTSGLTANYIHDILLFEM